MTVFILTFLLILVILCGGVIKGVMGDEDDDGHAWLIILLAVCFLAATVLFALGALDPRGSIDGDVDFDDIDKDLIGLGAFALFFFLARLWADQ